MAKLIFVDEDHNLNAIKNIADALGDQDAVAYHQLTEAIADAGSPLTAGDGIDLTDDAISVVSEDGSISVLPTGIAVNVGNGIVKAPVVGDIGVNVDDVSVKIVDDKVTVDPTWLAGQIDTNTAALTAGNGIDIANDVVSVKSEDGSISVLSTGVAVNVGRGIVKTPGVGDITVNTGDGLVITDDKVTVRSEDGSISVMPTGLAVNVGNAIVKAPVTGDIGVNVGDGLAITDDKVVVKSEDGSISVLPTGITVNTGKGIVKAPVVGDIGVNVDDVSVKIVDDKVTVDPTWLTDQIDAVAVKIDPDGGLLNDSGAGRDELAVKKQQAGALRSDASGMFVLHKPSGHTASDNGGLYVNVTSLLGDPVFIAGIGGISGTASVTGEAPVTVTDDGSANVTVGLDVGDGLGTPNGVLRVLTSDGSISVTADGINANVAPSGGLSMTAQGSMVKAAPGGHILVSADGTAVDVDSLTGDQEFIDDITEIITGGGGAGSGITDNPDFIQDIENIVVDAISISGTEPVTVVDDAAGGYTLGLATGNGLQVIAGSGKLEASIDSSGGLEKTAGDGTQLGVRIRAAGGLESNSSGLAVTWTDVPPPTDPTDAASKAYVDAIASGSVPLAGVRVASTAAGALTGQTVVDGVTLAADDRVLLKDQADPIQNGIYVSDGAGGLTRADDANEEGELRVGSTVFVSEGTVNANASFAVSSTGPDTDFPWTPDVEPTIWVKSSQIAGYVGGDGLGLTGNVFSVNVGDGLSIVSDKVRVIASDGSISVTPDGINANVAPSGGLGMTAQGPLINLAADSGLVIDANNDLRVKGTTAGTPGDPDDPEIAQARIVKGQVTSTGTDGEELTFTHNLASTQVAIDVSVNGCEVTVDKCRPDANTVQIRLGKAPATTFDIVVTG